LLEGRGEKEPKKKKKKRAAIYGPFGNQKKKRLKERAVYWVTALVVNQKKDGRLKKRAERQQEVLSVSHWGFGMK